MTHSKLSMHCNIVTQNNPFLMEICGENWVEINRMDAAKYGVQDGGYVIVESPKDKIRNQGESRGRPGSRMREHSPRTRIRALGHGVRGAGEGGAFPTT